MLKNIISRLIAQWFTFESADLQNPEAWIPSPALIGCRRELGGEDPEKQAKLEKDIVAWVIREIRDREKEIEKEKVIKEFVGFKLADPKPFKRVASSKLAEEIENAKKQRKDWQTLSNISYALREASSKYIKDYDNLEAPREVVEDPLL
jgi:rRNA maturation endonuclease Nob1